MADDEIEIIYQNIDDFEDMKDDPVPTSNLIESKILLPLKRYRSKHMRLYPELYRSDVSIYPSYTGLKNLPYHVIARRRLQRVRKQMIRQFNWEVMHFAMMQRFAIDGARIERTFCVGISPGSMKFQDFATDKERRRINQLIDN